MVRAIRFLLAFSILLAGAASAEAGKGNKKPKSPEKRFNKADVNRDGKLSLDEFVAKVKDNDRKAKATKRFAKIDKNKDSAVSLDELKDAMKAKGKTS